MTVRPGSVNELKKGSYVMIDNVACRVVNITTSKPGKHGHAKARIEAVGLIDERKREIVKPTDARIDIPIIDKRSANVLSISGDTAQVMDEETFETFDLKIPEELKDKLKEGMSVQYWDIVGQKIMKAIKS
ncbi:MAG TPA: translation initiation factor IF-5A [Candidatus Aenigmarchaeota archaeon]|nr:MAG: translation initiation factor IF-5A [Nanoarchaeota archaeon]HDO79998.1 translation initiation factor IF-5A [Candidatus Aenigmarchaeota archaeon]HEX33050.1 translation initiation factor IF-5A [Candidatus Aenigmarchaeota archaeon]